MPSGTFPNINAARLHLRAILLAQLVRGLDQFLVVDVGEALAANRQVVALDRAAGATLKDLPRDVLANYVFEGSVYWDAIACGAPLH